MNLISKTKTKDSATATLVASTVVKDSFKFKNPVRVECIGPDGVVKWVEEGYNLMTNEGLEDILDVYFSDGTQDATHYIGLKGAGAVAAGDTLASHANWSEVATYTGNRKAWTEAGVSSKAITNTASPASFAINDTATVAGAFLTNAETGTTGVLVAAIDFTSSRSVLSGDTLNVTYSLTIADA